MKRISRAVRTPFIVLFAGAGLAIATAAGAQTASDIAPDNSAPPTIPLRGSLDFSGGGGLAPPEGADRLNIVVADVRFQGARPEMASAHARMEEQLTRGRIRVSEIFEAATALQRAYIDAGFVLARVVIPAQSLSDGGTLTVGVVDGFIETVDAGGVAPAVRSRIERLTFPLANRRGLTLDEIERRLLLAGDTYGVSLGSALETGASPAGTVVLLDAQYRPVTGFVAVDNLSSDELGPWTFETGLEFNGLLGFGEVVYARFSGPLDDTLGDDPSQLTGVLGLVVPLNDNGLNLNIEATATRSDPDTEDPQTSSRFDRLSFRLSYPVERSLNTNFTIQAALDVQQDRLEIDGFEDEPIYDDKTRVLRGSADYFTLRPDGSSLSFGATYSSGIDGAGADGTAPDFRSFEYSARYRRSVFEAVALSLTARGQTTFGEEVPQAEKLGIAKDRELSGFDEGAISGDSGYVVRLEAALPRDIEIGASPGRLSPFVFGAHGRVTSEVDDVSVDASSYGIGVDVLQIRDPDFSQASVRIEFGRGERSDEGEDETRVSVSGNWRF